MNIILHIIREKQWLAAEESGFYRPASLIDEGFIHCSTPAQVTGVANVLYAGQEGLVLLVIDPTRVPAEIRFEDCYETGQAFPHIYGPLPCAAVVRAIPYEPGPDGLFPEPPVV